MNILKHKKLRYNMFILVIIIALITTIILLATPAKALELPRASSILSMEMEQFNDHESLGQVIITDSSDIETALSVLYQTRKTLQHSVNDFPTQGNYLAIRLNIGEEQRTQYLYVEGNTYYIEVPYDEIYKSNKDTNDTLYDIYNIAFNNGDSKPGNDILQVDSPNGAYFAKAYGTNPSITAAGLYPYEGLCVIRKSNGEIVWNEDGYYNAEYLWSDDSRYVAVSIEARTWEECFIVDAETGSVIKLPDINTISAQLDTESQPATNRSDPSFKVTEWVNDTTVCVNYGWISNDGDNEVSGIYEYDLIRDDILSNTSKVSDSPG